jgi:hypothetical protein
MLWAMLSVLVFVLCVAGFIRGLRWLNPAATDRAKARQRTAEPLNSSVKMQDYACSHAVMSWEKEIRSY